MKKLIKAVLIGYAVMYAVKWFKDLFRDEDVNTLDDLKRLVKEKL